MSRDTKRARELVDRYEECQYESYGFSYGDESEAIALLKKFANKVDRLRLREETKWKPLLAAAKDVADSYRHLDDLGSVGALDGAITACEEKP